MERVSDCLMYDELNSKVYVVGIGVSTLDMFTVVDAFPRTREVQKASKIVLDGGGPVATAMVTLAKLGANTIMIDNLGDDWSGLLIVEDFKKYNVHTHCLEIFPEHSSSIANILVEKDTGIRAILYHPGSVPEIREITKYTPIIQGAKVLHLNGRHLEASLAAIDIAKHAGVKISFDGGANRYNPNMRRIVPKVDICILAKEFALTYTDETKLDRAGESLIKSGLELVVITDGINGSWVFDNDIGVFHQPAFKMDNVVDTTGCGDSYHGGFLYGLLHNMPLKKCAEFASAVAALNTQALGGRKGLPSLKTVEKFLLSH
ncbi:carbohydrate kinase family protein [Pelosinus sp. Bkl1]|uniref:Carbohydrate kinase family protein n=2 Tax=Pelosinus baikalensis TaxID=2892015 RepID=A0ABS8HRD5_9FIRM|nr:carbohydrate kinase family protein [Pelosinus baikalensis]